MRERKLKVQMLWAEAELLGVPVFSDGAGRGAEHGTLVARREVGGEVKVG